MELFAGAFGIVLHDAVDTVFIRVEAIEAEFVSGYQVNGDESTDAQGKPEYINDRVPLIPGQVTPGSFEIDSQHAYIFSNLIIFLIMKALNVSVVVHITDLNRSINYYKTILGFTEDFRHADYAGIFRDNVSIQLCGPTNQGQKKTPGGAHFCIDCDEVDAYFEDISNKGAFIEVPPGDRYYGVRDFAVNDPDGNTLVFGTPVLSL